MKKRKSSGESEWNAANIIALSSSATTFLALLFAMYQNYISDNRYEQNEKDNNKELSRIRDIDSIRIHNDSVQTRTLVDELKNQKDESERIRAKDVSQLKLFTDQIKLLNESVIAQNKALAVQTDALNTQNQSLEVERLSKRSELTINAKFNPLIFREGRIAPAPEFIITNVGNSMAQSIRIACTYVASSINQFGVICYDASGIDPVDYELFFLQPGNHKTLRLPISLGIAVLKNEEFKKEVLKNFKEEYENNFDKSFYEKTYNELVQSLNEKEFVNLIIVKVSCFDKYSGKPQETLLVQRMHIIYYDNKNVKISLLPAKERDLPALTRCAIETRLDYDKVVEAVKQGATDNSSILIDR